MKEATEWRRLCLRGRNMYDWAPMGNLKRLSVDKEVRVIA